MNIERTVRADGLIYDKITLTEKENAEIDRCHEILRLRFKERGEEYTKKQQEMCEWWLQGLLRFEGVEQMVSMAQSAPFHSGKGLETPVNAEAGAVCSMKKAVPVHVKYVRQALILGEIASKLKIVAYRSGGQGSSDDKNAVLFYTAEDDAYNRLVKEQPVRYTRSEAAAIRKRDGLTIPNECIYRDSFWSFENSDANGLFSWDFANRGQINLQLPNWKERLEGHISAALLRKRQREYVWRSGGWDCLIEADEKYNSFNRSIIIAMKQYRDSCQESHTRPILSAQFIWEILNSC